LLLITAKEAERNAEIRARIIPSMYFPSTLKIMVSPKTTINPKKISYQTTFLLKKMGSIIEVKKAPVDKHAKVIDTLETLIALKKVNQCSAITNPATKNFRSILLGSFIGTFLILI
jgi:hypothetical protein